MILCNEYHRQQLNQANGVDYFTLCFCWDVPMNASLVHDICNIRFILLLIYKV